MELPYKRDEILYSSYRTAVCGEISEEWEGRDVVLSGWVHRKRDHGSIAFIDLRDHYGIVQVVIPTELKGRADNVKLEYVIKVEGKVQRRSQDAINPNISTGYVEVLASSIEILSTCEQLPFQIAEDDNAPESLRLKYRFLDLRREKLHRNMILRSDIIKDIRAIMHELGFLEFQTPILTSSSPEGARDFLVPSRKHPGKFFALPQAPQQFKQLIMTAGFDRYFQIAPCFRDEDPRADRSPGEFYQLDLEMAFPDVENIFRVVEEVLFTIFTRYTQLEVTPIPFPRIPYREVMERFGTDKPDLRFGAEIFDVTDLFRDTQSELLKRILLQGGSLKAIGFNVEDLPSRKILDQFSTWAGEFLENPLASLCAYKGEIRGSLRKFATQGLVSSLCEKSGVENDKPVVFFISGGLGTTILKGMGRVRLRVGEEFDLIDKGQARMCFITEYPMYELDEQTNRIDFSHNPFSMPVGGLEALTSKDPLDIIGYQYDVVCNGNELGSGAIRNKDPEVMIKAFEIAGYKREEVERRFKAMINAFRYGAPPHGGIALGLERLIMLVTGERTVRDVILFPLAQTVEDLMMGAPSEVSEEQLREVHIEVKKDIKREGESKGF